MTAYRIIETTTYTVEATDADDAAQIFDYADREHDFGEVDMVDRRIEVYKPEIDSPYDRAETMYYERDV
jgi:hypothetical protein